MQVVLGSVPGVLLQRSVSIRNIVSSGARGLYASYTLSHATATVHPALQQAPCKTDTTNNASSSWWTVGGALAACAASITATIAWAEAATADLAGDGVSSSTHKILSLGLRQRIFFKYEKRIRDLSTLEKIFEYFASHHKNGVKYMSARDVVRSLVPTYPPSESQIERAGFLDGELQLPGQ